MALILAVFKRAMKDKKIIIVFHSETVRKQDAKVFEALQEILEEERITIETAVGLSTAVA